MTQNSPSPQKLEKIAKIIAVAMFVILLGLIFYILISVSLGSKNGNSHSNLVNSSSNQIPQISKIKVEKEIENIKIEQEIITIETTFNNQQKEIIRINANNGKEINRIIIEKP